MRNEGKDVVIEQQLGAFLDQHGLLMGTAESCTGGRIASMITAWPGSSRHYAGSIVSYSNEVKEKLLHVSHEDLERFGAVSRPVVEQMATGALHALGCDCAMATSGIAGPDGGTPDKPVGTVWVAAVVKGTTVSHCYRFGDKREDNIVSASHAALRLLIELLRDTYGSAE